MIASSLGNSRFDENVVLKRLYRRACCRWKEFIDWIPDKKTAAGSGFRLRNTDAVSIKKRVKYFFILKM